MPDPHANRFDWKLYSDISLNIDFKSRSSLQNSGIQRSHHHISTNKICTVSQMLPFSEYTTSSPKIHHIDLHFGIQINVRTMLVYGASIVRIFMRMETTLLAASNNRNTTRVGKVKYAIGTVMKTEIIVNIHVINR